MNTWYLAGVIAGLLVWLVIVWKLLTNGTGWGKALGIAVIVLGGWRAEVAFTRATGGSSNNDSSKELRTLAAATKPGDIVMYSTTECAYCAEAKHWLNRNGFAFDECNMSVSAACESEFRSYGATGTPYLIVRGHHMKDGFDSDELLAALRH
jgi:glutaredoxin